VLALVGSRVIKKMTLIIGILLFSYCLALLVYVFVGNYHFLRETIASVSGRNVLVEVCPILASEIPRECSLAANQEAVLSSLLKARKELPLSHPESQKKLFFRIRSATDNGSLSRGKSIQRTGKSSISISSGT
jgi:hypothetical protein